MNFGKIEGNSQIGGIIGAETGTTNNTSKIINCYNIGDIVGKQYLGEILGNKAGKGTNYIVNCYGVDRGNLAYNNSYTNEDGSLEVNNCFLYTKEYMKKEEFLKKLNDYVVEYNNGEKTESSAKELIKWKIDEKAKCPTIDL